MSADIDTEGVALVWSPVPFPPLAPGTCEGGWASISAVGGLYLAGMNVYLTVDDNYEGFSTSQSTLTLFTFIKMLKVPLNQLDNH